MEKVKEIVADIQAIVTIIAEDIIGLAFTPLWYVIDIIERSIETCNSDTEEDENLQQPEQEHHHIGFKN